MLLITRPNFLFKGEDNVLVLPLIASITAAVSAGATELLIQRVKEDQWVLTWYAGVFQVVLGFIAMLSIQRGLPVWEKMTVVTVSCILLLPLTGTGNQILRTMALRMTKDVNVILMRYGVIVFCFIWDPLFLHRTPHMLSLGGVFIILATGVYMVCAKVRNSTGNSKSRERGACGTEACVSSDVCGTDACC